MIGARTFAVAVGSLLAAGCAVQEGYFRQQDQYFRPEGRQALGRDGYVGATWNLAAGSEEGAAVAVVAVSPMIFLAAEPGFGNCWKISGAIEIFNRLPEPVTFLPASVKMETPAGGSIEPVSVTRLGDPARLSGPVEVLDYSRACFVATWMLKPAEVERLGGFTFIPSMWKGRFGPMTLSWAYRYGGKEYTEKAVFTSTDSELSARSLAMRGREVLSADVIYPEPQDVPFLSDDSCAEALIPPQELLARRSPAGGLSHHGVWWPLEGERPGCVCPYGAPR